VIRPLEPEAELPALQLKDNLVGALCENSLRRYLEGKAKWDGKFSGTLKGVEKERRRNLRLAHKEGDKSMGHLESYLQKVTEISDTGVNVLDSPRLHKVTSDSWNFSWALDEDEHPPPSSIVSRRDTWEARQLAMIADIMPETTMSGNNLWQHLVTFLTVTPDKRVRLPAEREHPRPEAIDQAESDWTNVSMSMETDATTMEANPPAQASDVTRIPTPLNLGSANTQSGGWSHWTRGLLWKEKFRVNRFSKAHKRGSASPSSTTSPAARSPIPTLA
jgi:hypothetical protein